jgi:hypothetical protein
MKRLLLTGLLLLGMGQMVSFAQTDDIYFNSSDIEKQKQEDKINAEQQARQRAQGEDNYSSSGNANSGEGNYQSYGKSYDNDGYIDYDNDNYYSTRIRRFNYPFYNMGYYSAFYNPYWYDPYWYDPYWGWSAWNRPGFNVSFGYGPYWNSYWSWYTWYGYPAYYSSWNYPYYANPYGSYYTGYWNGYYAGMYGNYGTKSVSYGPRNSTNFAYHSGGRNGGLRTQTINPNGAVSSPSSGLRSTGVRNNTGVVSEQPGRMNTVSTNDRGTRTGSSQASENAEREIRYNSSGRNSVSPVPADRTVDRPVRGQFSRDDNEAPRYSNDREPVRQERPVYQERQRVERPVYQAPRQEQRQEPVREQRYEQPRFEQRQQPRYEAPRSSPSTSPMQRGGGGFGGRR